MQVLKKIIDAVLLIVSINCTLAEEPVWTYKKPDPATVTVPVAIPSGCPFEISGDIGGITFTGRYANYTTADTWYPSWAADGNLYSPWTDGNIHGIYAVGTTAECHSSLGYTGMAKIEGDDPMNLTIVSLGKYHSPPEPYGGRYPCGSLVHNGVWYYGTYGLAGSYWKKMGTFPGFRISTNYGQTWQQTPLNCTPGQALFPEPEQFGGPVKFGAPHFVDFGRNMEHSPDGKAYLVAHGATQWEGEDRPSNLSWITGDQIYLCRVVPSPANINDESKYEYFAGHDTNGAPIWSYDFQAVQPLLEWNNNMGCVTITYNAPLKKYFMCVTNGWPNDTGPMDTYILESTNITGPWRIITYWPQFGVQGYFVNIPSKFISQDGTCFWLCYSANYTKNASWTDPAFMASQNHTGSTYTMSLHEVNLNTISNPCPAHQAKIGGVRSRNQQDVALQWKGTFDPSHSGHLNPAVKRYYIYFTNAQNPGLLYHGESIVTDWTSNAISYGPLTLDVEESYLWQVEECMDNGDGGVYPPGDSRNTYGPVWSFSMKRLLAEYLFEQNAADSAGDNHGTVVGNLSYTTDAAVASAVQAYAASPDGTCFVRLPVVAYPKAGAGNGLDEGTISFWIKNSLSKQGMILGTYNHSDSTGIGIDVYSSPQRLRWYLRDAAGMSVLLETTLDADSQWHHAAIVFGPGRARCYIDGAINNEITGPVITNFTGFEYPITLMARNLRGTIDSRFSGKLDDVKIFNYALTKEEVAQVYYDATGKRTCLDDFINHNLDFAGPAGVSDCVVNFYDFAAMASEWLSNGFYPPF